jgi:hypothetical protein
MVKKIINQWVVKMDKNTIMTIALMKFNDCIR